MDDYFAGGHLRFVNSEWRDDNGDAIEISRVRHGKWIFGKDLPYSWGQIPKINIIYIALNVQNKHLTDQKITTLILMWTLHIAQTAAQRWMRKI